MQPKQAFGGEWTEIKLNSLKGYLQAYMNIMKDRKFETVYIDAFAGTGYRFDPGVSKGKHQTKPTLFDYEEESGIVSSSDGSARVALQIEPSFSYYVFVEKTPSRIAELEKLRSSSPKKNKILIRKADANTYLVNKCTDGKIDWKKYRAVLFLDPFGMSVKWSTLEAIAKTKAFDIWYLFPLGAGANRLLKRDRSKITEPWIKKLDDTFGTHAWFNKFYKTDCHPLFDSLEGLDLANVNKAASFQTLKNFVLHQLIGLFGENCVAANPKILCNSKNSPMYLLCFATSNPNAAGPAIKIAQHLLKV